MLRLEVANGTEKVSLEFEHSLLSLSKWEAKTKKPFLATPSKSPLELVDYFVEMLVTPDVDPSLVYIMKPEQFEELFKYMNDSQSASVAPTDPDGKKHVGVLTSETLYMQMTVLKIPFEAQTWHLNRLMMLLAKVAEAKAPPKKRSGREMISDWHAMNKRNKERFNSNG